MPDDKPATPVDLTDLTYFIVPPYGMEFSDHDKLIDSWRANGLDVIEGKVASLDANAVTFLRGFAGGGILACHSTRERDRQVLEFKHTLKARKAAYGTSIGNDDAMQMNDRVQVILPDPVPRWVAKLAGIPTTPEPTVTATFEHVNLVGAQRYVLIVPRANRMLGDEFVKDSEAFALRLRKTSLPVRDVVPDLDAWFGDPSRTMFLYEIAEPVECPFLQFAKLYYVAEYHDVSKRKPRLDSVHLLANFGNRKPNFRKHWTSNR